MNVTRIAAIIGIVLAALVSWWVVGLFETLAALVFLPLTLIGSKIISYFGPTFYDDITAFLLLIIGYGLISWQAALASIPLMIIEVFCLHIWYQSEQQQHEDMG